jgi:hypothetical protein
LPILIDVAALRVDDDADVHPAFRKAVLADHTEVWRTQTVYDAKGRVARSIDRYDAGEPGASRPATTTNTTRSAGRSP